MKKLVLLLLVSSAARAQLSPYEQATIEAAVSAAHAVVEPQPEGKIFEGVIVATLPVFEERDPLPAFAIPLANWFHVTTRDGIIEQEVLLSPGEPWQQALIDQTARNLRALSQLSVVLLVPVRGSSENAVRLLVITKDVWSLRLNSSWLIAGGRLQSLLLQPTEENLLGVHHELLGTFLLDPATITLGLGYRIPRLAGSRVAASAAVYTILDRQGGKAEGTQGAIAAGQPLYSTRAEWAWSAGFSWVHDVRHRFVNGLTSDFNPATGACVATTGAPGVVPCQYHRTSVSGSAALTRSFGALFKEDVTLGFAASKATFTPFDLGILSAADQSAFLGAVVPVSDTTVGPSLGVRAYDTRYLDRVDLDTLGLTENVQRGHDLTFRVSPVLKALGSSRDLVDLLSAAAYTLPLGDGVVRAAATWDVKLAKDNVPDASLDASLRAVSPRSFLGRLVFDAHLLDRYRNFLNLKSLLGGDTRLRGYAAGLFSGANLAVANLEFRSRPLEIFAVQLGGVAFADSGDAFDDFARLRLKSSTGVGLRVVFPQLQRYVLRIDLGVPLTRGPWTTAPDVVVTFNQALPNIAN